MHLIPLNQVITNSASGSLIESNTDETIDGSSHKITFSEVDAYVDFAFDAIDPGAWEEISLQLYFQDTFEESDLIKIQISNKEFFFDKGKAGCWNHYLIDANQFEDPITSIRIHSLVKSTKFFFDAFCFVAATFETIDNDIVQAIENKISLNYGVETTLDEDVLAGAELVPLKSVPYIYDSTVLQITDGTNTETLRLLDSKGTVTDPLQNSYLKSNTVIRAICPPLSEDSIYADANPICGIRIFDSGTEHEDVLVPMVNAGQNSALGAKLKQYPGRISIIIYIDCSSKSKVLSLSREFDHKYGNGFYIFLDGTKVALYLENVIFSDITDLGNNPRKAYFYSVEPQPITLSRKRDIDNLTLDVISEVST